MIDIRGLDKAEILMVLYNNASPQGMGFLHATPEDMSIEEARWIVDRGVGLDFDYLKGRVMKVSLDGDEFDPGLYNRDNGHGKAERLIGELR